MRGIGQLVVLLAALAIASPAATYTVGFEKTVTISIPQATAAYSVDPAVAEAAADQGVLTVTGKSPGVTHVIVITPGTVQTIDVTVPMPPPLYPKGWVTPRREGASSEGGYYETRYSSLPQQLTNVLDFARQSNDLTTHFHLATTNFFPSNNLYNSFDRSSFAVTSLSYSMRNERRSVTLVDQLVEESPLTIDGAIVRGLHWQEGNWFFHGGYTSPAAFQNIFLPVQREGAFGTGYRFRISKHSFLTPSIYYLTMSGNNYTGKPGLISSLLYTYRPREDFHLGAELGVGRGIGGSFNLSYKRAGENLHARLRYTPENFAALSVTNFRGLYSDLSWNRQWTAKLSSDVNFTGDRFNLPNFHETTMNGGAVLRYSATRHWILSGGGTYSRFQLESPGQPALEGLYYPVGLSFNSQHFGGTFQHQWSRYTGQDSGGHQWLASARTGWGQFGFSGYAERETHAPTLSFLLGQVQGLQEALTGLGLTATTPQQISNFLMENAVLINLNFLQNVSVNVTPVREQVGGSATWQSRGRQPQVDYEFLYNSDQTITSTNQLAIHRVTITQRLGVSNDISLTWAQYRNKIPGQDSHVTPMYAVSLRHHFTTAPAFLVLERHGTIQGRVFEDQDGRGIYTVSAAGMPGVELILDEHRRARTASDGSYRFSGVPEGKHQLRAILHTTKSVYFTTPEQVEAEPGTDAHFGVAPSLSSFVGEITNDTQRGVGGVSVIISGNRHRFSAMSGGDGKVTIPSLPEGTYDAIIDSDSLPPGYSIEPPEIAHVVMSGGVPGKVAFHVRALRSVSGRVLIYDRSKGQYAPVTGAEVNLQELPRRIIVDREGRYIFRDLPSGAFTISVLFEGVTINQLVSLPEGPSQQTNINLIVGQR